MRDLLHHKWAISESYFTRYFTVFWDSIARGHQLVSPKTIEDYIPSIEALLSIPDNEGFQPVSADVGFSLGTDQQTGLPVATVNGKNIALIPIIGSLTKYGGLCSLGMQSYQSKIAAANASDKIDGIVLIMDTPGGTVDGTPELGLSVFNSSKPIGVFGDNCVASAGMWIASQADVIVGNKNNPTEFGSIGVLMALPNYQNMMDAGQYPKVEIFRASQSTEKARVNSLETITDNGRADVQDGLDQIASMFIDTVTSGRGDVLNTKAEGLFAGRMFDVYQATQIGLIDSVGTLQTAVNKVAELARQKAAGLSSGTGKGTKQNENAHTMKFPKISSLFGSKSKEAKEVTMKVTAEGLQSDDTASLEAAEQKVAEMEGETATLKQEAKAKDEQIVTLNATVSEQKTQIAKLEGEKAKLTEEKAELQKKVDAKPTGVATTAIADANKEAKVAADASENRETPAVSSYTERGREISAAKEKEKSILV